MSTQSTISEALQSALKSASITAAASDMHAQVRLHHSGLLITVNSATESDERLIRWAEIDRTDDLAFLVSSETLTAVENIQRNR